MALDGTYEATIKSPLGSASGTLTLATDGDVLTGKVVGMGMEADIQDGVANGDKFTCSVEGDTPLGHKVFKVKGQVDGDTIKGKLKSGLIGASFEGTRAE